VAGVHALAQEVVHRLGLAHRRRAAVGAADRVLGGHAAALVGHAVVVDGHERVRNAARMRELEPAGAEALGLRDLEAGVAQAVGPEAERGGGN
jgi:hypothetical protein